MRKLFCFGLGFAGAVFACVYLLPGGVRLGLAALCGAVGFFCALGMRASASVRRPAGREWRLRVTLAAFGLALGLMWSRGYDAHVLAPAQALDGQEVAVSAVLDDWPEESAHGYVLAVRLLTGGGPEVKARLYTETGEDCSALKPGDGLVLTASLRLADTIAGQASDYYFSQGVFLTGYVRGGLDVTPVDAVPLGYWPRMAAKALKESVATIFFGDTAGFATALFTGDKGGLDGALSAALRRTGAAHVVAVSGLHVSFLAGLLAFLLGKNRRSTALVTLAVLFFFALTAGGSPSALRAVWLQAAMLFAPLLDRENDPPTSLVTALMVLLLLNPYAAASVSLQLSFAAVAGIYLVTNRLDEAWTGKLRGRGKPWYMQAGYAVGRFVAGSLAVTCGALLFTMPLMAYYFGAVSLVVPLANLLTLWAVSDAFLLGLPAAVLGVFVPAVGAAPAWVADQLLRYVQWVVAALSGWPFAAVPVQSNFPVALWLLFVYGVLLLCVFWRRERGRALIPVSVCAAALAAAVALSAATHNGGALRVSVLDVGQGESVLFSSGGQTALVDCGGTGSEDPGDVAADAVQAMGRADLDYLILTHYHADHAGGAAELLARLDVGTLILPDVEPDDPLRQDLLRLAGAAGIQVLFVETDMNITIGNANLAVYAPLGDGGANEEGLSVLAGCGTFDVLVTGDMNAAVERRLVKYGALPDIEMLVVGHHGSAASSSEELLMATWPELAVISVGYNTYGHPAPETMERLGAAGCDIYRTDLHGTVTVTYGGN